jgi:DNA-binding LacI/PurR family transcriptional regulator
VVDGDQTVRPKPTISDVARLAGVSKGLVSFVFNNRPGVAPRTRERILQVADELGWRPSVKARALSTRTSFALGLVLRRDPQIISADPFFPAFMAGVDSVLNTEGRVLVLSVVPDQPAEERTYRSLVCGHREDGVFLTDLRQQDARISLLQELAIPAVTLGRPDVPGPFPAVNLDDAAGITAAVRHLIRLGHTQIAHVAGDPLMLHSLRRAATFCNAMRDARLDDSRVMLTDFSAAGGAAATRALLDATSQPTAIVYANDPMAIAGLSVLHQRGVRVPEEMSVIGFDGTEMGRLVFPSLTTIVADPVGWGVAATRTLLTLIADGHAVDVELPPARLMPGDSTAAPHFPAQIERF